MKIFIELKRIFALVGIEPDEKPHFNVKHLSIMFLFIFCFVGMSAFCVFEAISIIDLGASFYGAACLALNIFTFSSNVLRRNKIFELITNFEEMIKKRSFQSHIYEKVNGKIEKCTKIFYMAIVPVNIVSIFVPILFVCYWLYFTTDLGSDAFKQTFPMSMPFDWKTPIGYATTISIQCGAWFFVMASCCCIICFLGGVCWFLVAMIEDIAIDFHSLNEVRDNEAQLKTKLNEIIQFHSTAKQFVYDFSEIYEIIITGFFLWGLLTTCCSLIIVHVETSKSISDPVGLFLALIVIFWSFAQIFVFCEFGQYVNDRFSGVDNIIYFSEWYVFPKEIQRLLPIVMISAQQPLTLTGFANLSFTREAFKKVVNGGFSYFMMIRRMYH